MEGQFQTSFIPKRPISQNSGSLPRRRPNVAMIISMTLFFLAIILAIGVFAYEQYLQSSNVALAAKVNTVVQGLQPSTVGSLIALDTRIESVKSLLAKHVALSNFFSILASGTLKSVQFTGFQYVSTNTSGGTKITISMTGRADSFASVALQADNFSSPQYNAYIQNPSFSGFALDSAGNVTFVFTATLNPSMYLYDAPASTPDSASAAAQNSVAPADNSQQSTTLPSS